MPREFALPDLGEGITEAQVTRVLIAAGDRIAEDQALVEVETDKASVEIPSPYAGIVGEVRVAEGQTINVGDILVTFDQGAEADQPKPAAAESVRHAENDSAAPVAAATVTAPTATVAAPTAPPVATAPERTKAIAAPAVRKLARDKGIALDEVRATGPGGRVTRDDVENHRAATSVSSAIAAGASSAPQGADHPSAPLPGTPGQDSWGPVRKTPLTQIRKAIAAQMAKSAFSIPHVTQFDEADVTELERTRASLNEEAGDKPKLTMTAFVIKAVCAALKMFPEFNASFDEQAGQMIFKGYHNIGIAVDTPRGLVVPNIRNADRFGLSGLASELRGIAEKIRANRFAIDDLRGGTFTITNVGAVGGSFSTPIINAPEVAILGTGRARQTPVIRDGEVTAALILPLSLSFDHRACDGAQAARFTREIIRYLEMPARLLL